MPPRAIPYHLARLVINVFRFIPDIPEPARDSLPATFFVRPQTRSDCVGAVVLGRGAQSVE